MNTRTRKKAQPKSFKERLIDFPNVSGNHLDELLAKNPNNPFVQMVRWFFLYPETNAHEVRAHHVPSGAAHHRKSMAH